MCPEKHKTARVSTDSMANCVTFALSEVTRRLGPRKGSPYSGKPGTFLPERIDLSPSLQPPFYRSLTTTRESLLIINYPLSIINCYQEKMPISTYGIAIAQADAPAGGGD